MTENQRTKIIGLFVIVLLVGGSTAGVIAVQNNQSTTPTTTTTTTTEVPSTTTPGTTNNQYIDGTYTATGSYSTPEGSEEIDVTVTLQSNTISSLTIDAGAVNDRESQEYTQLFISGIDSLVVGKSIDEVNVSRVSGSSLTSNGFNAAIETIKNDAKA